MRTTLLDLLYLMLNLSARELEEDDNYNARLVMLKDKSIFFA